MANARKTAFPSKGEPTRLPRTRGASAAPVPTTSRETALFAAEMLKNPAFEEVMERFELDAYVMFVDADMSTPAGVQKAHAANLRLQTVNDFRDMIKAMADELKLRPASESGNEEF